MRIKLSKEEMETVRKDRFLEVKQRGGNFELYLEFAEDMDFEYGDLYLNGTWYKIRIEEDNVLD